MNENDLIEIKIVTMQDVTKQGIDEWYNINKDYFHNGLKMSVEYYSEDENCTIGKINYFGDFYIIRLFKDKGELFHTGNIDFNKLSAIKFLEIWDSSTPDEQFNLFGKTQLFSIGKILEDGSMQKEI